MREIGLKLDSKAEQSLNDLMQYYKVKNRADLIYKGLALLKTVMYIEMTNGELIARRGDEETEIVLN